MFLEAVGLDSQRFGLKVSFPHRSARGCVASSELVRSIRLDHSLGLEFPRPSQDLILCSWQQRFISSFFLFQWCFYFSGIAQAESRLDSLFLAVIGHDYFHSSFMLCLDIIRNRQGQVRNLIFCSRQEWS